MTKEFVANGLGVSPIIDALKYELKCRDIHDVVFESLLDKAIDIKELQELIEDFREKNKHILIQPSPSVQRKIDKGIK